MAEIILAAVIALTAGAIYIFGKRSGRKLADSDKVLPEKEGYDPVYTLEQKIRKEMSALARRRGIPLELIVAQVKKESGSGKRIDVVKAKGSSGEAGLMQIKPIVLREYNTDNERNVLFEKLWEYEWNLEVGTWYLAKMKRRFGNWRDALIAYNIGPTRFAESGPTEVGQSYARTILSWAGMA